MSMSTPHLNDGTLLLQKGIARCRCFDVLPADGESLLPRLDLEHLTRVSPMISFSEDNQYSFYKNILDDESFPITEILNTIAPTLEKHFVTSISELKVDDMFCVHYNESHSDSTVAKHMDPSDITVNVSLERSLDLEGSQILFYGSKNILNSGADDTEEEAVGQFLVSTDLGMVTIHFGAHSHEVVPLRKGRRTNVVITLAFKDKSKSQAGRFCMAH